MTAVRAAVLPDHLTEAKNGSFRNGSAAPGRAQESFSVNSLSAQELKTLGARNCWSLSEAELSAVQSHFRSLKREPTRAEIETIAQSWSEHCRHKTFRGRIRYQEGNKTTLIKSLFDHTIAWAARKVKKPWCLSLFKDNAGIIRFGKKGKWALAFKVETHNHPCAVEPYGGAETGLGGVIRDVLGAGLGAKPVLLTDVFCAAPPSLGKAPSGVLPPERILDGLVCGVRDYGNRMGIPTAGGALYFDEGYLFNPLVFVGAVGILPAWAVKKRVQAGDLIVAAGGRAGRDGIHGATFSSAGLNGAKDFSAVQIGHPLNEKKLLEALLRARDRRLYHSVTDCGAGGFSSAIIEMAGNLGARVDLERAALKTSDLDPWEIWLSESQERMVFAVPAKNLKAFEQVFRDEESETRVLGTFVKSGRVEVRFNKDRVVDLSLKFLKDGLPQMEKRAVFTPPKAAPHKSLPQGKTLPELLKDALSHPNVRSREWLIRQYDHEVQGQTVIKPLQGVHHDGPGDACVLWPHAATGEPQDFSGFAVGHGLNPSAGKIDPYRMAWLCVDEALRNLLCSGADALNAALLDNFCWGNPDDPRILGSLVRAALGCRDAAIAFGTPFISGKDSLYNEAKDASGRRVAVPGTLLISAAAPVPDVRKAITMDFKGPGHSLYLAGQTSGDLGGSLYHQLLGVSGGMPPSVDAKSAARDFKAVYQAIQKGLVASAHDPSEGGLIAALSEMAFSGEFGAMISIDQIRTPVPVSCPKAILFSESPSRLLLEVRPENETRFLQCVKGTSISRVGSTIANPILKVIGVDGLVLLEEPLAALKAAWQKEPPLVLP